MNSHIHRFRRDNPQFYPLAALLDEIANAAGKVYEQTGQGIAFWLLDDSPLERVIACEESCLDTHIKLRLQADPPSEEVLAAKPHLRAAAVRMLRTINKDPRMVERLQATQAFCESTAQSCARFLNRLGLEPTQELIASTMRAVAWGIVMESEVTIFDQLPPQVREKIQEQVRRAVAALNEWAEQQD